MRNTTNLQPPTSTPSSIPYKKYKRVKIYHESHKEKELFGTVFCMGTGDMGQLGLGEDLLTATKPIKIPNIPPNVIQVEAGGVHSACLTIDGKVFTWGCNDDGALGRVTEATEDTKAPVIDEYAAGQVLDQIKDLKIIQISCGDSHTAALTDDGRVYIWGTFRNVNGKIGLLKEKKTERKPVHLRFKTLENRPLIINKITSGNDHVCCLSSDGRLFTFGNWEQGQLGRNYEEDAEDDVESELDFYLQPRAILISEYIKFDNCWCSYYGTFARTKRTKKIYVCGLNNYNQLNVKLEQNTDFTNNEALLIRELTEWSSNYIPHVVQDIASSEHHTVIKCENGAQYSIGRHHYGRLGLGTAADAETPQLSPYFNGINQSVIKLTSGPANSFAITTDFKLYGWGMHENHQIPGSQDAYAPLHFSKVERNVLDVSCGAQHVLFLVAN